MKRDQGVLDRISELVEEEQSLYREDGRLEEEEVERLQEIKEELDRCWDLLRRRRARREFGRDPEKAEVPEEE